MFGAESGRLLRERWKDASDLAEELYAMFLDDIPASMSGGLTLSAPNGQPPLTINLAQPTPATGDQIINFTHGTDAVGYLSVNGNGEPELQDRHGNPLTGATPGAGGPIPARIIGGAGSVYSAALYANGFGATSTGTVSGSVPGMDPTEHLQAGTPCWVSQQGANNFILVALWVE